MQERADAVTESRMEVGHKYCADNGRGQACCRKKDDVDPRKRSSDFADKQICRRGVRMVHETMVRYNYRDCKSLPGLNLTAFPGGIFTSEPVRGFRPIPVLRGLTENTP